MKQLKVFALAIAFFAGIVAGAANAQTITFDELSANTPYSPLVTQGFTFYGAPSQYTWLDGQNANNGTNNLVWGWESAIINFARIDNASFSLQSLDLGTSFYSSPNGFATLTADLLGGGSFSTTLALTNQFQTFALGLNDVVAVHIQGVAGGPSAYTAMDNVVITAIPEPETYALLLAGLGLIGTIARRRTQA